MAEDDDLQRPDEADPPPAESPVEASESGGEGPASAEAEASGDSSMADAEGGAPTEVSAEPEAGPVFAEAVAEDAGDEASTAETPQGEASSDESEGGAQERKLRQELGIGGAKVEVDQEVIDQLLRDAVVGYEDIFASTSVDGYSSEPAGMSGVTSGESHPLEENLHLLRDVHMKVKVELGRGQMYLKDILRLGQGSVVELERLAGDPLDIYVNDKVIARGEVLVLNENFCIRITEICDPADTLRQN